MDVEQPVLIKIISDKSDRGKELPGDYLTTFQQFCQCAVHLVAWDVKCIESKFAMKYTFQNEFDSEFYDEKTY